MTKINLGFSPCPNDTFIFDALVHKKIDTLGLDFEIVMEDVEQLNQRAFRGELDVTKLSFHAYAFLLEKYVLLDAGSALGRGCGPLLIAKPNLEINNTDLTELRVAIPGKYTTANFLLSMAYPKLMNKQEMLFSDIENAVLNNEVDAGLIIHENRFTYQDKGLKKIIDLGEYWETKTKMPIPLGGIVVNRKLPIEDQQKINIVLKASVDYAFTNPESSLSFTKQYAQEMDEAVMQNHIALYVNDYSLDLGREGKKAIEVFFEKAVEADIIQTTNESLFLNP